MKADSVIGARIENPSVSYGSTNLYMKGVLEAETRHNLDIPIGELVAPEGGIIQVRAPELDMGLLWVDWWKPG